MVTLEEIFRDVVSSFPLSAENFEFFQITNWINETYVQLRDQYIQQERHIEFAKNDVLSGFNDHPTIPYLKVSHLSKEVLRTISLDIAVVNAIGRTYPELKSEAKSWNEGDKVYKGNNLYEAVTDIPQEDTSDLTFDILDVRNYYRNNGLLYNPGDVVYENDVPYRAINEVLAVFSDALKDHEDFEQVYWVRSGIGFVTPDVVEFDKIDRKKSIIDSGGVVISVVGKTIYTSQNTEQLQINYIPEHSYIRTFEGVFDISASALPMWRDQVHSKMARAINMGSTETENKETTEEDG